MKRKNSPPPSKTNPKRKKEKTSYSNAAELASIIADSKFDVGQQQTISNLLQSALTILSSSVKKISTALYHFQNFVTQFQPSNDFLIKLAQIKISKIYLIEKVRQDRSSYDFFSILLTAILTAATESSAQKESLQPLLIKLQRKFFERDLDGGIYDESNLKVMPLMERFPYAKTRPKNVLETPNYFLHNVVNLQLYVKIAENKSLESIGRMLATISTLLDLNERDSKKPPKNYSHFLSVSHSGQTPFQALIANLYNFSGLSTRENWRNYFIGLLEIFLDRDKDSNLDKTYFWLSTIGDQLINYITAMTYCCLKMNASDLLIKTFSSSHSKDINLTKEFKENDAPLTGVKTPPNCKTITLLNLIVKTNITLVYHLPWDLFFGTSFSKLIFQHVQQNSDANILLLMNEVRTVLNTLLQTLPYTLVDLIMEYFNLKLDMMLSHVQVVENWNKDLSLIPCSIFNDGTLVNPRNPMEELSWSSTYIPVDPVEASLCSSFLR